MGISHATLSRVKFILSLLLIYLSGIFVFSQNINKLPNNLELENFVLPGYAEDGSLKWLIEGRFARFQGDMIFLRQKSLIIKSEPTTNNKPGISARFYDEVGRSYTLSSPECDFNSTTRQGTSKEAILLKSDHITISGNGYDVWVNEQKVIIHSNVKIKLRQINELNEESFKNKNKGQ